MMKNRIITIGIGAAILFSLCTSCFSMVASAETITANTSPYLSEFFELSLNEIEEKMDVHQSEVNTNLIVVNINNNQLRKLISELEPQKDEIGNDAVLFRIAFFNLFLDKLHLTGIYDTVDAEYSCADMPSAWWDPMNPFVVEESDDSSEVQITLLYPDYQEEYVFEYNGERVTIDRYEATQRSLYVMNTYGNKDYFTWAYEAAIAITPQTTDNTTDITTTTTTATTADAEKITDIEQIRSMLIAFVEENGLDARIVSDKEYPGYRPIVVEFNRDAEINAWAVLSDYIEEQNIDKFNINVVPIVDGKPITTANPDAENTTTTTTTTTTEAEKITDIEQIREMFTKFITDSKLDAKCVSDEAYPQYAGTVVIEFNSETAANTAILEYAEKNNIERTAFNLVPCVDGKPITTVNPDAENTTTTTTTTTDGTNTDLPQTGNNSMTNILIAIATLMLTAAGAGAVHSSGILLRKEDEK